MGAVQLAGLALLCCMLLLLLRELRPALLPPIRVGITLITAGAAFALYAPVLTRIHTLFTATGATEYAAPLLRALGIATICELTATLCRDLGEGGVADGVQLFGRIEILVLCLPLVDRVLELAKELLQF
jgi:hypothetical protein